jgi:hypothetical protein
MEKQQVEVKGTVDPDTCLATIKKTGKPVSFISSSPASD